MSKEAWYRDIPKEFIVFFSGHFQITTIFFLRSLQESKKAYQRHLASQRADGLITRAKNLYDRLMQSIAWITMSRSFDRRESDLTTSSGLQNGQNSPPTQS